MRGPSERPKWEAKIRGRCGRPWVSEVGGHGRLRWEAVGGRSGRPWESKVGGRVSPRWDAEVGGRGRPRWEAVGRLWEAMEAEFGLSAWLRTDHMTKCGRPRPWEAVGGRGRPKLGGRGRLCSPDWLR